jgi:hypothetical protein
LLLLLLLPCPLQEGDFVVLVQEYAAGGNLFELLQKYGGRLNEHVTVQMVLEPFLRVLQVWTEKPVVAAFVFVCLDYRCVRCCSLSQLL